MNLINIDRSGTITASSQASGMVQLTVSFNTSAVNLTALVLIEVIHSSGVRLEPFPYPSYPGSDANPITALNLIEDTGVYQRALLQVQLLLSNNSTRDVSSHASTIFSTQVVIGIPNPQISSSNVLSVVSNGIMDIIVTFGPDTIRVLFTINSTPVRVTGISVNPLSSNTLRGIAGMSFAQASVDLTFSDGTQFVNFPTSSAFTLFQIPGLVSYSSPSGSPFYNVTQDGRLQPLMNTITPVTLQATAGVSPISGTTGFVVNLDPDVGDVDLGQENGVAIPRTQLGATLVIPVRVNTGGRNLGSIDIMVMYDSSVLAAVSVDVGPDWGSGVNDASLNDPPGEIRFGGALFADGVAGTRLHLFTLRLRVISGTSSVSQSFLRGTVLTFAERNINGTNIGPVTPRPIVAGNLMFEIQNNVGKRSASRTERHSPIIHTPAAHKLLRERRATGSCPSPPCPCSGQCPGDTDGNCVFDIRDVTYALIYITESLLNFNTAVGQEIQTRITSAQLQQLDPTLEGIVNTNDAYFLLRAVFRLIYFLEDIQVTPIQDTTSGCLLTIQVWLRDADNISVGQVEVVTDVAFRNSLPQAEFESSMLVRGAVLTSNKGAGLNGGLILAERTSEDVFIVQFMSDFVTSDIGVSVIAVSFDAQNSTSTSRIIQFLGPPPPTYTGSLDLSLSIRNNPIQIAALSGYSPLQTFSNTIPSSQCSDLPLLTSELNVTFPSPFQAELQWGLLNMRMGLDFTSLLQLSIYNCYVDQSGTTVLDNCTAPIQTPVQNDTMHSLPVRPFTDYFFQVSGSTTNTSLVKERSPEAPPEGVNVPLYSYFESGIHFSWSLPSTPNGIITHYTLYVDGVVVYNGSSTARTLQSDITQPLNYSLEAHNSAGSTTSETGVVVTPTSVSATRSPGLNIAITDFIIIAAVLTVSALIVLISAMTYGMVRIRQAAKDKPPSFLSSDFFTENFGVERQPLADDSVCVLLPLGEQKGKRFAEKFAKEDPRTFWYKDERKIELLPPPEYDSTSSDSSEGEELPEFDEQFELGGADTYDNKDIYDLWDESPPVEGKGRKHSTLKRPHDRKTSKDSSRRHSSILRRISFGRQPMEQDELHLLEEAELGDSEFAMGEELAPQGRRDRRQRKTSAVELKKKQGGGGGNIGWRTSPPLQEIEEETAIDEGIVPLPQPSSETAEEVARRLRTVLQSGEYQNEYKDLVAVKAASAPVQSARSCNTQKNRYRNVLAADHSRVKLKDADPMVDGSEYINANYISGHGKAKAYIATQGPLPNTIADFWRMVWQEGSESIVMATGVIENQRKKSEKYWPDKGHSRKYGPVIIKCTEQIQHDGFTESKLMVTCDSHLRRVTHYHYTSWPDFGSPATNSFLEMSKAVGQTSKGKPIVVHCSAGLGRSGVFITVHTALECFRDKRKVSIKDIASKIRNQREGMIQSQDQYRFCLEAVANELAPEVAAEEEQVPAVRPAEPLPPPPPQEGRFTSPVIFVPDASQSPLMPPTPTIPRRNDDVTEESGPSPSVATSPPPTTSTATPSQRASPPPPSSSPPPPISEPQTPLKASLPATNLSTPEITYTPPTPRMSREESNRELIQRKLDSMASERDKEEQRQSNKETTIAEEESSGGKERTEKERPPAVAAAAADRYSVRSITQRTPIVKPEPIEKSSPEETRPTKVKEGPTEKPSSIQPPNLKKKDGQKEIGEPKTSKEQIVSQEGEREQPKSKGVKDKAETHKEAQKPPPKFNKEAKEKLYKSETSKEAAKPPTKKEAEVKKDKPALPLKGEPEAKVEESGTEETKEEEEEGGFSIGDDLLDFKPPPKKSLKDEKQPKPSSQPSWRYPRKPAPSAPPSAPRKPAPSSAPPPPSTHTSSEPAPVKKKRPQTPKQRPREIMRSEPDVYAKAVRKLVIPSIFGGAAATESPTGSPQPSPKPSPRKFGQPIADTTKRENEPQLSPGRKPPAFGQRVLPVKGPGPRLPTDSHTEVQKEPATKAAADSEEKQMNVLDRIKLLEGRKEKPTASTPSPTYKLPTLPQKATWSTGSTTSSSTKPTYKLPQKPATVKTTISESKPPETTTTSPTKETALSESESSSSGASAGGRNVARLLARFQGGGQT